jgi:hypothetical protein
MISLSLLEKLKFHLMDHVAKQMFVVWDVQKKCHLLQLVGAVVTVA